MKTILVCLVITCLITNANAQSLETVQHQINESTATSPTPEQVYYQMLHNDSVTTNLIVAVNDYDRTRNTGKVLELTGGILLVTMSILSATDNLGSSSNKIQPMHDNCVQWYSDWCWLDCGSHCGGKT